MTLTVSLASPTPSQLDTGAQAFATLDAGAVSAATPAATLAAGERLRPQPARLHARRQHHRPVHPGRGGRSSITTRTQIFNFLHTQIGYNSYLGSVRGARGTLWSSAGNALDVASLGVALMRASGIPAQYAQGTLSQSQAQQLILSMFPATYQTVGYIPAGTQTSDPANDPQLLAETEAHYWFQFNTGSGMTGRRPAHARRHDRPDVHDGDRHVHRSARRAWSKRPRSSSSPRSTTSAGGLFGLIGTAGHDGARSDVQRRRTGGPAADDREFRQHPTASAADLHRDHEHLYALHRHGRRGLPRPAVTTR